MTSISTDTHRVIDAVWKIESPRLIAGLARIVRDVGVAEDLAQDALVAALEQWPESGVPDNPGAWLMATAKHRAIDHFRRNQRLERKHEELGRESIGYRIGGQTIVQKTAADKLAPASSRVLASFRLRRLRRHLTTTSVTTCCAWCSQRVIRCFRPRRELRSRCDCSEA